MNARKHPFFKAAALILLLALMCLTGIACAEESPADWSVLPAEDITASCLINGFHMTRMYDGKYNADFQCPITMGERWLTIEAEEPIGGVLLRWRYLPPALNVQSRDENGDWVTFAGYDGKYYAQYYPGNGSTALRFTPRDEPGARMALVEITVYGEGELPDTVQVWQDAPEKVDIMLFHGHPDDELLWFGGLIPYYSVEKGKQMLTVCTSSAGFHRRLELLDAMWACGLRNYPVFCNYTDVNTTNMDTVLRSFGENSILDWFTALVRQYRPDVVVTQDVNGEYGHGVHRVTSYAVRKAVDNAMDEAWYPESAALYGLWDVPKTYLHLWPENTIEMDWFRPAECFGGKSSFQVAAEAMLCHASQTVHNWYVREHGEHDNTLFGLYRTTVGPDENGGDMFEHIR